MYRPVESGEVFSAEYVQDLMNQRVLVFQNDAERNAAIPTPTEGMLAYRKDIDALSIFDGTVWRAIRYWDTGWKDATLLNGWANYGGWTTAQYRKASDNIVVIQGLIKGTAATADHILTLPVGYRPAGNLIFCVQSNTTSTTGINVYTDGKVTARKLSDGQSRAWVALNGITFGAA